MIAKPKDVALRFAAMVRVSTEQQAETGESLRTQRGQIEDAVKLLGGKVVEWYGGQEHATSGWEKKEISRLLADAKKKSRPWDAVVVSNADRWSRDNESSHEGLEVFRRHKVRFFVGASEHNLFDPENCLFLELSAVIGKFQARSQNKKSMLSRIHRAQRGVPTAGRLPYGRTFDKSTGQWGIDKAKQRIVEDVARRYLAGEHMADLADEYGVNHGGLHMTLTRRCGDVWEQKFNADELDVHQVVKVHIPRLLPEATIRAVLARVGANRTYTHGQNKHAYLLGRMIFCARCGYAMDGESNMDGVRYYRHASARRVRSCSDRIRRVRADALEDAVLRHLFNAFGNPSAVQAAIEEAVPDLDRARQLQDRLASVEAGLKKQQVGHERVLRLVLQGRTTEEQAGALLEASNEKVAELQAEKTSLEASLTNVPTVGQVKAAAEQVANAFRRVSKSVVRLNAATNVANSDYGRMTWAQKRELVQQVFAGKTLSGQRLGVYLERADGGFRYTIRGQLITLSGRLPSDPKAAEDLTDPDYADGGGAKYVTPSGPAFPRGPSADRRSASGRTCRPGSGGHSA